MSTQDSALAKMLQASGRKGDTKLAHVNPDELRLLTQLRGKPPSINPTTGLMEFWDENDGPAPDRMGADFGGNQQNFNGGTTADSGPGSPAALASPQALGAARAPNLGPQSPLGQAIGEDVPSSLRGPAVAAASTAGASAFGAPGALLGGLLAGAVTSPTDMDALKGAISMVAGPVGAAMALSDMLQSAGVRADPPGSVNEHDGAGPDGNGSGFSGAMPNNNAGSSAQQSRPDIAGTGSGAPVPTPNDTGGSGQIPAYASNLLGYRPTTRRELTMEQIMSGSPLQFYDFGAPISRAEGGEVAAPLKAVARDMEGKGRFGDQHLVHLNPNEHAMLAAIRGAPPSQNPETGVDEFFDLGGLLDWILPAASAIAPSIASEASTGIGSFLGDLVGNIAPETGSFLADNAQRIGGTLLGGGLGALTSGGKGAIAGALGGAFSPEVQQYLLPALGLGGGGGGNAMSASRIAAGPQALGASGAAEAGALGAGPGAGALAGRAASAGGQAAGAMGGDWLSRNRGPVALGAGLLSLLTSNSGGKQTSQQKVQDQIAQQEEWRKYVQSKPGFQVGAVPAGRPLQPNRQVSQADIMSGRPLQFYDDNRLRLAEGGEAEAEPYISGQSSPKVSGPGGGRSDSIPAMLDDGEYVWDAETVALAGDGDRELGWDRIGAMRELIRKTKGKELAKGKIGPMAPAPEKIVKAGMRAD